MNRKLLAANASHDIVTEYLEAWSDKLLALARTHSDIEIFELKKASANRKQFEEVIAKNAPRLVVIHGHGGEDLVCGYALEVLVKCDENPEILQGKIVHALSCKSSKKLAPKCIEVGTLTYLGYKEDFQLAHLNKNTPSEQAADKVAALFLDPAFEVIKALIEKETVGQAFARSQVMYKSYLSSLVTGALPQSPNYRLAGLLYHNFMHQTCSGDTAACF